MAAAPTSFPPPSPFLLAPAFRHGADTPWGGALLRDALGKAIPDERTGEALELSAMPGLASRAPDGTGLDELLRASPEAWDCLAGEACPPPFPLLIKLLHARDKLSVQAHPDDAYAKEHEQGASGKTEAWVILSAEPGATIVYGFKPGTDVGALREKLRGQTVMTAEHAAELAGRLNTVFVQSGEVYYLPAGTVHALGAGVMVYEIQQASGVTYRLWDYMRRDALGNLRELHLAKALDVLRGTDGEPLESLPGVTLPAGTGNRTLYIADEHFALERLSVRGRMADAADGRRFRAFTALGEGTLSWDDARSGAGSLPLSAGSTVFVPACVRDVTLSGTFDVLKGYVPDRDALRRELGGRAADVAGLARPGGGYAGTVL